MVNLMCLHNFVSWEVVHPIFNIRGLTLEWSLYGIWGAQPN